MPLAQGRLFGARIGRIEQVEVLALEMGRGQAVGDEDHLPIGRVLGRQERRASCSPCWMLVKWAGMLELADVGIAHVDPQPHHGVENRHRLGQQRDDFAPTAAAWRSCRPRRIANNRPDIRRRISPCKARPIRLTSMYSPL